MRRVEERVKEVKKGAKRGKKQNCTLLDRRWFPGLTDSMFSTG